uniref:Uncharacterized protein n=1 Tax=Nelumbo nucifera TaxID=4432 RepID=A0A822Y675_NELNU|nr:TPA_asm: hypothetical protein HUJ06_029435 [Nelumbo nucifera]
MVSIVYITHVPLDTNCSHIYTELNRKAHPASSDWWCDLLKEGHLEESESPIHPSP